MTLNIRPMCDSDIDNVDAIERDVHIAPWSKNILRDCVRVGYDCYVLEMGSSDSLILVGYIICRYTPTYCHILNFSIAKLHQSKGYGRYLLTNLLDSLAAFNHIHHVVLEVRPSNKVALHLYKTMGFKQVEIKQAYYKENQKVEDAILLKKIL